LNYNKFKNYINNEKIFSYTLTHQDYRSENIMINSSKTKIKVFDWQLLKKGINEIYKKGNPFEDYCYLFATSLSPELQKELNDIGIKYYYNCLIEFDGENNIKESFEDILEMFNVVSPSVIGINMLSLVGRTEQNQEHLKKLFNNSYFFLENNQCYDKFLKNLKKFE
jgi:hypothetical protein